MFLNHTVNLLKVSAAEEEFQAKHKSQLLEKVSLHFSLTQFVSFSLL